MSNSIKDVQKTTISSRCTSTAPKDFGLSIKSICYASCFFIMYTYLIGNPYGFDCSPSNYILNLIGIRATFNSTWWYILIYYYMVLISPIVFLLKKCKFKHYASIVLLFIISLIAAFLTHSLFDYIRFISKFIQIIRSSISSSSSKACSSRDILL